MLLCKKQEKVFPYHTPCFYAKHTCILIILWHFPFALQKVQKCTFFMGLLYPLSDSCKKHIVTKRKLKSKKWCLMPPIKRQTSIAGGTVKYLCDSLYWGPQRPSNGSGRGVKVAGTSCESSLILFQDFQDQNPVRDENNTQRHFELI